MSLTIGQKTAKATPEPAPAKPAPQVTYVQKVLGGDTYLVMAKSQIELEDEFANSYFTASQQSNLYLQPPFDPQVLLNLAQTNNTLNQCVEVMEVNIDGTGYDFVKADEKVEMNQEELGKIKGLFDEPYPQHSFSKIRRKIRRELESVGYAYLEVLRSVAGEIVGFRNMTTHNVRMVKLDDPVLVKRKLIRNGKEVELQLWSRERRFVQRVAATTMVYYKEFGVERDLNRETGKWAGTSPEEQCPPDKKATELIMIGVHPDIQTPYFVPRWVNQMPSVVGSRKAEEQNLEFFDAGGMPPAIVFIQGGTLAGDAADQLRNYLSGKNKNKHRAVVVEAQSSSGSLDSAGAVQVKVERFGGEKGNDMLFEKYDTKTEEHVRVGFRIPPLFLGKAADYNFATAITTYMVAEAQVFKPERDLFDELINTTILRSLGIKTVKLKSKPITLQDVANQLKGIELSSAGSLAKPDSLLSAINAVTGLNLEALPPPPAGAPLGDGVVADGKGGQQLAPEPEPEAPNPLDDAQEALIHSQAAANDAKAGLKPGTTAAALEKRKATMAKAKTPGTAPDRPFKKTAMELVMLAKDYASMSGLLTQKAELSEERQALIKFDIDNLEPKDLMAFNELLATYTFGASTPDLVKLTSCNHVH
jgi:PBSX family phage portal protein